MEAYALHKSAMIAPRKARMTLDLIRGKELKQALSILNNTNTKGSRLILKVLNSAVANAVNNLELKEENLYISECYINPGPVLKRMKYGSRTNIDRRDKRTSHIYVQVKEVEVKEKPAKKEITEKKEVEKKETKKKASKSEEAKNGAES